MRFETDWPLKLSDVVIRHHDYSNSHTGVPSSHWWQEHSGEQAGTSDDAPAPPAAGNTDQSGNLLPPDDFNGSNYIPYDMDGDGLVDTWFPFGDTDSPGGGGGGYPPRTVEQDLEYLRGKYPIDEKLLMKEYELQGKAADSAFLNQKELQALEQKDRLAYLRENIKLTRQMELELIAESHKNNLELQKDQQIFDEVMQEARFTHEKELREEDLKLERQRMTVDLLKDDPVQAVLMSMGLGDAAQQFGTGAEPLGALEGEFFEKLEGRTEQALSGLGGAVKQGAEGIDISAEGVSGLAGAHKQAKTFGTGSDATKTLLTSAHSIGGPERAGQSAQETQKIVQSVTPQGIKRAAGGIGYLPALGYRRAASGVGGVSPVEPNTSYTVGEGKQYDGTRPEVAVTGDRVGPTGNPELLGIRPLTESTGGIQDPRTKDPTVGGFVGPDTVRPRADAAPLPRLDEVTQPYNPQTGSLEDPRTSDPGAGGFVPPDAQPAQEEPEIVELKQQLEADLNDLLVPFGTNLTKFQKELAEARANGLPFTPEQHKVIQQIKRFQKEQSVPRMQEARQSIQKRQLQQKTQVDYRNRRSSYLQSLPPEQRRRVQAREVEKGKEEAARNIDVTKLGPEVIQQLVQISNDPSNPQRASAGEKLGQLLPAMRRDPNVIKGATGLASFLGK